TGKRKRHHYFFQTGGPAYCRYGDHPTGYPGTRGFFRGNGTYTAGAGLRGSGDQRYGRSAEPYHNTVETAGTVSDPGIPFYQQNGPGGYGPGRDPFGPEKKTG